MEHEIDFIVWYYVNIWHVFTFYNSSINRFEIFKNKFNEYENILHRINKQNTNYKHNIKLKVAAYYTDWSKSTFKYFFIEENFYEFMK